MGGFFGPRLTIGLPLNPLSPGQDSCHALQELLNGLRKWLLDVTMKVSVLDLKYLHAQLTLLSMTTLLCIDIEDSRYKVFLSLSCN